MHPLLLTVYYSLRPLLPRPVQIALRRNMVRRKLKVNRGVWPICPGSDQAPADWTGWPEGARFAVVLTHDVETAVGVQRVHGLMQREKVLGFISSFNFVPQRYDLPEGVRNGLTENCFEVGLHGLKHDGKLFLSRRVFRRSLPKINRYLEAWGAKGFYAPSMLRKIEWIASLAIEYDSSTFDTDPFEPQPDGVGTVFPYLIPKSRSSGETAIVELPYTMPQDLTLFVLMQERDIDIWKEKLRWLAERGGMVLLKTHPDYMNLDNSKPRIDEYPGELYMRFLEHLRSRYAGQYWHVLPRDMARFWRQRFSSSAAEARK